MDELIWLRTYIEAGIDFPEEEIDLLADGHVLAKIMQLIESIAQILNKRNKVFCSRKECVLH
ncbi:MAG: hypothetical protein R3E08_01330 [Thiotrichaceae bacterium]